MQVHIWHNPRCSKSRETLKLIQDRGIEPNIRRYLDEPPSKKEIVSVLNRLDVTADKLVRRQESIFKDLGLDNAGTSEDMLIAAMVEHPKLIERPVVTTDKGAVIGRPPEKVLEIL